MSPKVDVTSLANACMSCKVCPDQRMPPPCVGVFQPTAKVLVIGQNPGWVKPDDASRMFWIGSFKEKPPESPIDYLRWCAWDFSTSHGAKTLTMVLGDGWLTSGWYSFSNAVRCRTEENAIPDDGMIDACAVYTRQMMQDVSGLLLMGKVALKQVSTILGVEIPTMTLTEVKNWVVYSIPHYTTWGKVKVTDLAAGVEAFNDKVKSRGGGK